MTGDRGRRESRPRSSAHVDEDRLPEPGTLRAEMRDVTRTLLKTLAGALSAYRKAYLSGLSPGGGSGVHTSGGGPSKPTETAWGGESQELWRDRTRDAAEWIRAGLEDLKKAEATLRGLEVGQPKKVHDKAVVTQATFDRALHRKRERDLRGEE